MPIFRYAPAYPALPVLVEADDKATADTIFEYHTSSASAGVRCEEFTGKLHGGNKPVRAEDCKVNILGGYYTLQFRGLTSWTDVARVKFGPLWTTIWQQALATYGEENIRTTFTLSEGWEAAEAASYADARDDRYDDYR